MSAPKVSTDEFVNLFKKFGSVSLLANHLGVSYRATQQRRQDIAARLGIELDSWNDQRMPSQAKVLIAGARIDKKIRNGRVIVFSDAHYIPGVSSTAHRGLLWAIKKFTPGDIVNNGDAFDGASISRHPRIGWDKKPSVMEELQAVKDRLDEIEAIKKGAGLTWLLGNHDARYETYLAANAPQYEGVAGFRLKDHFPFWKPAWRFDINAETTSWTIIKHRGKGGVHAAHNNAVNAGSITMVTGHLHSLKVTPLTNARGTCWGVDTGTLADPEGPQFNDYTEDSAHLNWRSGFAMLTYKDGRLLTPELFRVVEEGVIEFRGELIEV